MKYIIHLCCKGHLLKYICIYVYVYICSILSKDIQWKESVYVMFLKSFPQAPTTLKETAKKPTYFELRFATVRWLDKNHQNGWSFHADLYTILELTRKKHQLNKQKSEGYHVTMATSFPLFRSKNKQTKTPPLIASPNTHGWKLLHNSNTSAMAAVAVVFEWSLR